MKNFFIIIIGIFIAIFSINIILSQLINKEKSNFFVQPSIVQKTKKVKELKSTQKNESYLNPLTPSKPIHYDIPLKRPQSPEEWEMYYQALFDKSKVFDNEGGAQALDLMQTHPEDLSKQKEKLEQHIAIYEQKLKDDPFNEEAADILRGLYKLKGLGNAMEERVLSNKAPQRIPVESSPVPKSE